MARILLLLGACSLLEACASLPDLKVTYFPAKARTDLVVTQVVTCGPDGQSVSTDTTVEAPTRYSADYGVELSFRIRNVDRALADTSANFTLLEDGRLVGFNVTSTGQGDAVAKAVAGLGTAVATLQTVGPNNLWDKGKPNVCDALALTSGKALTLKYATSLSYGPQDRDRMSNARPVESEPASEEILKRLRSVPGFRRPYYRVTFTPVPQRLQFDSSETVDAEHTREAVDRMIFTRPVAIATLSVGLGSAGKGTPLPPYVVPIEARSVGDGDPMSTNLIPIPIPRSPVFGKQTASLELAPSGAITKLGYEKDTGITAVLIAATAVVTLAATR